MIQTVIFDMDGVIIDSEPIHFNIEKQIFEELKIAISFEEHCSYVGTSSRNMWEMIIKKHEIANDLEELIKKDYAMYMKHLIAAKDLHPIPGVVELIKELHQDNLKIIVASSSHGEVIDMVLKKFNLSDYFIAQVSGTELIHSKPHPEIFLRSAALANCDPGECVVIEDSENGVTAARVAGMKPIGFLNPNSGVQDLSRADVVVKSFEELNAALIRNV